MTDKYTPEMAHAAVERGAAWLDEHCPDWVSHIDLNKLDLGDQAACMLGQTAECLTGRPIRTSRYTKALSHLNESTPWAVAHGFDAPIHRIDPSCDENCDREIRARYEMLTLSWREYIRQRVETPA